MFKEEYIFIFFFYFLITILSRFIQSLTFNITFSSLHNNDDVRHSGLYLDNSN